MKKIIFIILIIFIASSCGKRTINNKINEKINAGEEINVLALGDSITYGYKVEKEKSYPSQLENKLKESNYKYNIKNYGISGDTSKGLLNRLDNILKDNIDADIAILTIGGNDGLKKRSTVEMKNNILNIIAKLEKEEIIVVFSGMKLPILFGWDYSNNFNDTYKEIAKEKDVYFYPYFLEGVGISVENNQADNIHPTAKGYTIISDNIYEYLNKNGLLQKL